MRGILLLWLIALPVLAQEIHAPHCLHGCPSGGSATNDLIIREIYVLSSNDRSKFADWVAYKVTKDTIGPSPTRTWKADPKLDAVETLEPGDYKGAHAELHTDRGHQVPLASFAGTAHWRETNYLSNITPQKSGLNQGPWQRLESTVRELAKRQDVEAVYVMSGPLYEAAMPGLPKADEAHMVPSGYWKIVAMEDAGTIQVAAFFFDQDTPRDASYCDQLTTVNNIEDRSGLEFFHALKDDKQERLEGGAATLGNELGCQ